LNKRSAINRWRTRAAWLLAGAACLATAGCATRQACDSPYAASPQFSASECVFRNAQNPQAQPSQPWWKIWTRFLSAPAPGTKPVDPIPVQPLTRATLDALDPGANHLVRLGHSSFLLKLRGSYWLIDPVFGERASPVSFAGPKRFHPTPLALTDLPPIEGLILSHDHYDHLDLPTIEYLREKVQRYFVPLGVGPRLQQMGVAAQRIEEFDWWQSGRHAGVELTAAPAQHFSGRSLSDRNSTLWASWIIQSGTERIFYSGDSGYFSGFKEIGARFGGFDVALMENGAYDSYWPSVHMTPEETVQAFRDVRGRLLYLVHNSTFDLAYHTWQDPLERVAALSEAQRIPLATPTIGEVLTIGRPRSNVLWWKGLR
jgi:L-ascorbate metabolism protein UlaG (beta-lactamase superfamily)